MTNHVLLYGARRTSTNATSHYIKQHFPHTHVIMNARHAIPQLQEPHRDPVIGGYDGVAITTKNPYAWLASITRWCHLENMADHHRLDHQLLEGWAMKHERLYEWAKTRDDVAVFRAENWATREGGQAMINAAARAWNMEPTKPYEVDTHHKSKARSGSGERFDPEYYTKHKYVAELGERVTNVKHLLARDWVRPVVEAWGYRVDPPGVEP